MIVNQAVKPGFTAVEVLIAMFIGSLLLMGGYQAYTLVIDNTRESRERALISSFAYDAMRRYEVSRTAAPCAPQSGTITDDTVPVSPKVQIHSKQYIISCPYGSTNTDISKVTVRIVYGSPQKEVIHAIYTRKS